MAARYTINSGNWSNASIWDGGTTTPADGDSVTITAGHSVLMDTDLSSYTGLAGLVVSGSDTTPAMLYFKDGTSGYLKIRTGYTIAGTNYTYYGRILANSDGVWGNTGSLAFANKAVIYLGGTSYIDETYLHVKMYPTEPTNKYVETHSDKYSVSSIDLSTNTITLSGTHGWAATRVVKVRSTGNLPSPLRSDVCYSVKNPSGATLQIGYFSTGSAIDITDSGSGTIEFYSGHSSTSTAVINVLSNVTSDTAWTNTTNHNHVVLVDGAWGTADVQFSTISSITSTSITLASNIDSSQYPGARLYLVSRNCSIQSESASETQLIVGNGWNNSNIYGEIRNTTGTEYGVGIKASNATASVVTGFYRGLDSCLSGSQYIVGCKQGVYTYSGDITHISGCENGLYGSFGSNSLNIGQIFGCSYGVYGLGVNGASIDTIHSCQYAIAGDFVNVGEVIGGLTVFHNCRHSTVDTCICSNVVNTGSIGVIVKESAIYSSPYVSSTWTNATGLRSSYICFGSENDSDPVLPFVVRGKMGAFIPIRSGATNWQAPLSNNEWIFEATPTSFCGTAYAKNYMQYSPYDPMVDFANATECSVTFNIYPYGWTTDLTNSDIILEVSYLDSSSGPSRSTAVNTTATYADGGWRQLTTTFTPSQSGAILFDIKIQKYESGAYVLIDPIWTVSQ